MHKLLKIIKTLIPSFKSNIKLVHKRIFGTFVLKGRRRKELTFFHTFYKQYIAFLYWINTIHILFPSFWNLAFPLQYFDLIFSHFCLLGYQILCTRFYRAKYCGDDDYYHVLRNLDFASAGPAAEGLRCHLVAASGNTPQQHKRNRFKALKMHPFVLIKNR